MRVIYYPIKDTTIYSEFPDLNVGLDEILEVGKTTDSLSNASKRALISFDLTDIAAKNQSGAFPSGSQYELKIYLANAENINDEQTIELRRTAEAWKEGSGRFFEESFQNTNGASWNERQDGFLWQSGSVGNSLLSEIISINLSKPVTDITIDVTSWINTWLAFAPNYGFTVKFPDTDEGDSSLFGTLSYFSNQTHTIYRPTLTAKWNDQTITTGSLLPSPTSGLYVAPSSLKMFYTQGETVRVDLIARPAYPLKTIDTMFTNYIGNRALPATSYFSIIDELTGTVIVPFDDYSRVSCDGNNSYITFRIENMSPLRYYRLKIKVDHDGLSEIFDGNYIFRVKA